MTTTLRWSVALPTLLVLAGCAGSGSEEVDTAALTAGAAADSGLGIATPGATTGVPAGSGVAAAPPAGGAPAVSGSTGGGSGSRPPARSPATGTGASPSRPSGTASARSPGPERPSGGSGGQVDTARGIAAVVGSTPVTQVIVRPSGGRPVTVTGPLANEIGVASGADVWVRGRRVDDRTIEATGYSVRTVDGQPALTGTLRAEGDRLVLVTDDGRRHPIVRPPQPLRELAGARVWITGDPASTVGAWGVLRRR